MMPDDRVGIETHDSQAWIILPNGVQRQLQTVLFILLFRVQIDKCLEEDISLARALRIKSNFKQLLKKNKSCFV